MRSGARGSSDVRWSNNPTPSRRISGVWPPPAGINYHIPYSIRLLDRWRFAKIESLELIFHEDEAHHIDIKYSAIC